MYSSNLKSNGEWQRVNRRRPCPVCGKFDFCEVSYDEQTVHCMRTPSDQPTDFRQGGWLHRVGWNLPSYTVADLQPNSYVKLELATLESRHRAIVWLLGQLNLSQIHQNYLKNEGFELEFAKSLGYRTLPQTGREVLVNGIVGLVGVEAARGLAFIREKRGKAGSRYFQFAAARPDLLLIPIRTGDGLFAGLKARWTTLDPTTGQTERHYRSLSAGSSGGASLGTPIHVGRPASLLEIDKIVVTEGEKKADAIAMRTGLVCLGVQGTGNWRAGGGDEHLVSVLANLGAKRVEIAFDADLTTNSRVARDLYKMGCQLQGAGFTMTVRRWPLEIAKGYDDLLRLGLEDRSWEEPFSPNDNANTPKSWVKKFVELEPETVVASRFGNAVSGVRALLTVDEARTRHAALFKEAFTGHLFSLGRERQSLVVTSNPGTGKSHAALSQAFDAIRNYPDGRILYLADTKEVYRQWLQPGALLYEAWQSGTIAVREGRQRDGDFECRKLDECQSAGKQRHAPTWDICATCPFFSATNWQKHLAESNLPATTTMLWNCQQAGYWSGVERARRARLVVAPKASFFNNSEELAEFDIIIVDESLVGHLLESVNVKRETLTVWREAIQRQTATDEIENHFAYQNYQSFLRLFELIEGTIAAQTEQTLAQDANSRQRLWPFLPTLKVVARNANCDLAETLADCLATPANPQTGRYAWERPFAQADGTFCFPLHFARELAECLQTELTAERYDTRLWCNRDDKEFGLTVYLPRQHLLDILRGTNPQTLYKNSFGQPPTTVVLDATPAPVLLEHILEPNTKTIDFEVAQHFEVTQTTNSLYTKDELAARDGKALRDVGRLLQKEAANYRSAAVFCHKSFNPKATDKGFVLQAEHPNLTWGHFDRDNKALNSLSNVEFIAIVGHYCHPIDGLRAQIQAFRFAKPLHDQAFDHAELWKLRNYAWQNADGHGVARRCRMDADADVQAAIEHSERSTILQAIGRGRPNLRDPKRPLQVLLVTAVPLGEILPLERLAETKELLGENTITLEQAKALANGRALRLRQNQTKRNETLVRVQQTINTLDLEAPLNPLTYLTPLELANLAGVTKWQLNLLGFDKYLRVDKNNKQLSGPELFIYFYKQYRRAKRLVFSNPLIIHKPKTEQTE